MRIIGLTGSIGMGKSFVAKEFSRCGVPVFDADKAVHALLSKHGKAVKKIALLFPDAVKNGEVDRNIIAKHVFGDKAKLLALEAILHPMVFEEQRHFIDKEYRKGKKLIVLEVPLLFEKGVDRICDVTILVTSSLLLQKKRVLSRQLMTEEKLKSILASQMSDSKKRRKADFIIYTGLGKAHTRGLVHTIIKNMLYQKG